MRPTKDGAFRDRERRRWEELWPDQQTILLEGAGHDIQENADDENVTAMRRWRASEHR